MWISVASLVTTQLPQMRLVFWHTAQALYIDCTFHFKCGTERPKYLYAMKIHSGNQFYTRLPARIFESHSSMLVKPETGFLGMKQGDIDSFKEPGKWLMLNLSYELQKIVHKVAKHFCRRPVVNALINLYRSSELAPDHLLVAVRKCLLDYGFLLIKESSTLLSLDSLLWSLPKRTT